MLTFAYSAVVLFLPFTSRLSVSVSFMCGCCFGAANPRARAAPAAAPADAEAAPAGDAAAPAAAATAGARSPKPRAAPAAHDGPTAFLRDVNPASTVESLKGYFSQVCVGAVSMS